MNTNVLTKVEVFDLWACVQILSHPRHAGVSYVVFYEWKDDDNDGEFVEEQED